MDEQNRHPIKEAASELARWLGSLVALVGTLATAGALTIGQANWVTAVLTALAGLVGVVATILVAFGTVRRSEPLTTPLVDPRSAEGWPLRAVPDRSAPRLPHQMP